MNPIKKINSKILGAATSVIALITILFITFTPTLATEKTPHWGYGGAANPTKWGKLSPDFAKCELGKEQSPINITGARLGKPAQIVFRYNPTPLAVVNNGHTIQVNYAKGSTVVIDGNEYDLLQFHFHTPSENTIEGKAAALELHLVHRNATGNLAVVGIMLDQGVANPLIEEVWKNIPATGKTNTIINRQINASNLLPKSKAYYGFDGSLTTPPCSEGVKWHVLIEPITVSEEQINTFQKLYQVDARPIQPLNGRVVTLRE